MGTQLRKRALWFLAWFVIGLAGALIIVRFDIGKRRESFQTDARIAHGMLSQRAVQHEAILYTLALLGDERQAEQRLPAIYPQVLTVLRRDEQGTWTDHSLHAAENRSRQLRRPVLGPIDFAAGQYYLVMAGKPSSFALRIDALRMVLSDEWPWSETGRVRAILEHDGQQILLQHGESVEAQPAGLTPGFVFVKTLASASQPLTLRLTRATGPAEWPWAWLAAWAALAGVVVFLSAAWWTARRARHRAEELLRVSQVARLNTLGELAGGIAHELNQPLTAVIASTQGARRLLDDDPPALEAARQAMASAAAQGRRAADVVARLRRLIESPAPGPSRQPIRLEAALRNVLQLLEPELRRQHIEAKLEGSAPAVLADPVALEQILHNLIGNAVHALADVPADERRLLLQVTAADGQGSVCVRDTGPGIAAEVLPHLFEPFYTARRGGLGLGLSLCESLALAMNGTLTASNAMSHGAVFRLTLPLAKENP
jgi:signal transduction histidine kinase